MGEAVFECQAHNHILPIHSETLISLSADDRHEAR
jgi:hypothetical protein